MKRLNAVPGVLLIAIAAALWGLDPILRKPLASSTSATTAARPEWLQWVVEKPLGRA